MNRFILPTVIASLSVLTISAEAHDTWVQTNTNVVRIEDAIHIDLMLGNHGNAHRDFKLASKVDVAGVTLDVVAPSNKRFDVTDRLIDVGYAPKEGFWTTRFVGAEAGVYVVSHTLDKVLHNTRGIKSAKAYFVVSPTLDKVSRDLRGFDRPLGHQLEIVPRSNPVAPMGPGQPISIQVLYHGKPLEDARVSFVPRGTVLSEDFDANYERRTDNKGFATYTPTEGNYVLVVVHHVEPDKKGEGYDKTQFTAALTVFVPQVCPCCDE